MTRYLQYVKAAGLVCVLGFGVGLGTLLLYKLYRRYFDDSSDDHNKKAKSSENDCHIYLESSDTMGNIQTTDSGVPVYYSEEYGIAFGRNHKSRYSVNSETVRHRRANRHDRDHLSKRGHSNENVNSENHRNSNKCDARTYPQAVCIDNRTRSEDFIFVDSDTVDGRDSRSPSLSHSLLANYSPKSLYDKNYRIFSDFESGTNYDSLRVSSVLLTPPSDDDCLPSVNFDRQTPLVSQSLEGLIARTCTSPSEQAKKKLEETDSGKYTASPSFESFGDANNFDDEGRDKMSPLRGDTGSNSDGQFRNSLLQRMHDFSSLSSESSTPRSPTPESVTPGGGFKRRCFSLDTQESFSGLDSPDSEFFVVNAPMTDFHVIEDELCDVQEDLYDMTSKISELLHRNSDGNYNTSTPRSPQAINAYSIVQKIEMKRRLCRAQSVPITDSEKSSRCNSTADDDLQCDFADDGQWIENKCETKQRNNSLPFLWKGVQTPIKFDPSQTRQCRHNNNANGADGRNLQEDSSEGQNLSEFPKNLSSSQESDMSGTVTDSASVTTRTMTPVRNICDKVDILCYANKEWKSNTPKASKIKQGYQEVPKVLGYRNIRRVRGDNYCSIRSTLFQIMTNGLDVCEHWQPLDTVLKTLEKCTQNSVGDLSNWNFGNQFSTTVDSQLPMMSICVSTLYAKLKEASELSCYEDRERYACDLLNSDHNVDLQLMEGAKLLMFLSALDLYEQCQMGDNVPVFAWLLFARDTSDSPSKFVTNHLNPVGNTGGLEQVEMFLLGHALGVTIQVYRLDHHGEEDFISYYPDEIKEDTPQITILAEDDRHYNVPVL